MASGAFALAVAAQDGNVIQVFDVTPYLTYPSIMLSLLFPPGGPDLCALTGFCQTAQAGTGLNLLFLASALVVAGVMLQRRGGGRRK